MLIGPRIAVIGAGSLRAAGPVLATFFGLPLDPGCCLSLCDSNAEMLDLYDRVARAFAGVASTPITVVATSEIEEAMDQADAVVLCFDFQFGDLAATFQRVNAALSNLEDPTVFNLVAPTQESGKLLNASAFHLDWPDALPDGLAFASAHLALRWVRADVPAFEPLQQYKDSPLASAILDARPKPINLYDPAFTLPAG